jgi:hypothetical protein
MTKVGGFRYLLGATLLLVVAVQAQAAVDATGKWSWTLKPQNGTEIVMWLDLQQDGEKLTGTITRGGITNPISEGKIKDNDLSFVVVREIGDNQTRMHYQGKLDGDTIKGNITLKLANGEDAMIDWTATRDK